MTRSELEKVRANVIEGHTFLALLAIDFELAKPEEREWRVAWDLRDGETASLGVFDNQTSAEVLLGIMDRRAFPNSHLEARIASTPAGPWERAK